MIPAIYLRQDLPTPGGSAPHVKYDWAVHDLWANRMSLETAARVLGAQNEGEAADALSEVKWYNATEKPYEQGLREGDARLFGEKIGVVKAGGDLKMPVKSHAAAVLRLRRIAREDDGFEFRSIAIQGDSMDEQVTLM